MEYALSLWSHVRRTQIDEDVVMHAVCPSLASGLLLRSPAPLQNLIGDVGRRSMEATEPRHGEYNTGEEVEEAGDQEEKEVEASGAFTSAAESPLLPLVAATAAASGSSWICLSCDLPVTHGDSVELMCELPGRPARD